MKASFMMTLAVVVLCAQPALANEKTDHVIGYGETKETAQESAENNLHSDGACGPYYTPVMPPSDDYKEEWVPMATGWAKKITFACKEK